MKPCMSPLTLLITLPVLGRLFCSAQWTESSEAAGQYIFYTGTVSGSVSYGLESDCSHVELKPHTKTYLYVGKYPPWDPNPFFLELYHLRSEGHDGRPNGTNEIPPGESKRKFLVQTDDSIFNLDFTTSAYACFKDGHGCGIIEFGASYAGVDLIDLRAAKTQQVSVGTELGYTVTGDQHSWVGNDTIKNEVDVATSCFENSSTPFTYNVTFSNSTATASLTLDRNQASRLRLGFRGQRVPCYDTQNATDYIPSDPSNVSGMQGNAALALNTSNPDVPGFTYANGSTVGFQYAHGNWHATAKKGGSVSDINRLNQWYLFFVPVVMLFLF